MKDYINREKMEEELLEVLKEKMENFGDMDDEFMNEVKYDMRDDNYYELRGYVSNLVDSFNRDMRNYVHEKDTSIWGNFKNIRWNFDDYCPIAKTMSFDEIVSRLDNGEHSELTEKFLDWVNDWFFDAFGTWGICYNFGDYLTDLSCIKEEEECEYEEEAV